MGILKDKRGFLARDWVMSLILFSGIVALFVLMVGAGADTYDNTGIIDENIQENYADLNEKTQISDTAFEVTSQKGAFSVLPAFGILSNSVFTVISLVFNSIGLATSQLFSFGEDFGVPTAVSQIVFGMFISIITVVIVFVVISTTTRRDF